MIDETQLKCPNKLTSKYVEYCLLFKTNLNVFESPARYCKGFVIYDVYPGLIYLKFNVRKKLTKSAPFFLTISKYHLYPETFLIEDEPLLEAEIPPMWYDKILQDPNAPPILKAVLEAMPTEKDEYAYIPKTEYFEGSWEEIVDSIKKYLETLAEETE